MLSETIFECRCCGSCVHGLTDGSFFNDPRGVWRRIGNVDGPNAICPTCVAEPDCLAGKVADGYEHACILIQAASS